MHTPRHSHHYPKKNDEGNIKHKKHKVCVSFDTSPQCTDQQPLWYRRLLPLQPVLAPRKDKLMRFANYEENWLTPKKRSTR
ncbi:hypothetical protein RR46_00026 [Papilio xuthus]|uniref:Uncharacterized protein n=1 Tax=Papilio xuthus TaxID=66420 RepID=A0A0N0PEY9_PAPXU|nr:hypothetical protein RR46_00026 [Papilio xuthus]